MGDWERGGGKGGGEAQLGRSVGADELGEATRNEEQIEGVLDQLLFFRCVCDSHTRTVQHFFGSVLRQQNCFRSSSNTISGNLLAQSPLF